MAPIHLSITEDFLIILILLELVLVLVDHCLGRILAALRRIGVRLVALRQVIHRVPSLLTCAMAVLVVLIVMRVVVEVALLLEVARGIRARLHVVRDVARLRPGFVLLAEVLRVALLVRAVLGRRVRWPERLDVVSVGGLLADGVATVRQGGAVVRKGGGCAVTRVNGLCLSLRSHLLESTVAASAIILHVAVLILSDVVRLHL